MTDCILSDLDQTLANTSGRAYLAAGNKNPSHSDWIEYSRACETDIPMDGPIRALQLYAASGYPVFLVSGRNVEAEAETRRWLDASGVPFDRLRLRREIDIQHNGDYKVAYIRELRKEGFNPLLMFEDHVGVGQLIEAEGVPVVSVNPRYDDPVGVNFNHLADRLAFDEIIRGDGAVIDTEAPPRHMAL